MNDFDEFCDDLLEQSKRFYEKSKSSNNEEAKSAFNNASLLLAICSLEAYINAIADEQSMAEGYPLQLKSALLEREIRLEKGQFVLTNSLKMSRLTDKLEIIYRRATNKPIVHSESWWVDLGTGIDLRNKLVHPKDAVSINIENVERVINAVQGCLTAIYQALYKKRFPKQSATIVSKKSF
jgi:hypothetical protein